MSPITSVQDLLAAPWWPELVSLTDHLTLEELSERFGVRPATLEVALRQVRRRGRPTFPEPRYRLAALHLRIGTLPDDVVASLAGVSQEAVVTYRREHGIAAAPEEEPPIPIVSRRPPPTLAFTVIATTGARRWEFVTVGPTMAEAARRAQRLLDQRSDGPWRVLELVQLGEALE